ncbi:helix-turn-helix domain-containing protein [Caldovatus aquaticus]|uniref:DUF4115 domain-containing protein n=1 Tax=Caldovatus aquaticus TaxID=2865671 RepID=A0ABS7F6G5_9PROT|nr:helix-turn-helix domain-containing protein [Caldovatus aquaticus]MBW8270396.1 DUF4115 domain-containing protein [Caldovatus aquaticus]
MKRPLRPDIAAAEAAARAGEELRAARLALGLSLEEVAERLRIRRPHLLALEEGRWHDLPGGAYALGFLRSYAQGLGLDGEAMVRRLRDSGAAAAARRTDLVFPEPMPERGVPTGLVVLAGAIVAISAYAAWYTWSGSGERVVDAVPPLPGRLEEVAREGGLPAATARAVPPPAPEAPVAATAGGAAQGGVPAGPAAASPPAPTQALAATVPPPAPASAPAADAAAPAAPLVAAAALPAGERPAAERGIVLRARGETWVSVREARGGPPLLNRILRPGETFAVPPREGLVLSVGRPDALEVVVDGEPVPALEGPRGRRMNIPLDAGRLKAANRAAPP